jgi:uncharacterized membrane-anchored protein
MKFKVFILVLALQTGWLLAIVARQEAGLRWGQVILLQTKPVDPRDPLRGDYVRLNYQISDVGLNLFSPTLDATTLSAGSTVFVALARTGTNQFWTLRRASREPFAPATNEVLLRGKRADFWPVAGNSIHVTYGIEQFYVAEGTGNPSGTLTAQVVVTDSGRASLKEVFVDGRPYREAMAEAGR